MGDEVSQCQIYKVWISQNAWKIVWTAIVAAQKHKRSTWFKKWTQITTANNSFLQQVYSPYSFLPVIIYISERRIVTQNGDLRIIIFLHKVYVANLFSSTHRQCSKHFNSIEFAHDIIILSYYLVGTKRNRILKQITHYVKPIFIITMP